MTPPGRFRFVLSLPERVLRSLGAVSGGLLREIGVVALPSRIRRTALYRTMVEVTLRFLIEQVGQVQGIYPSEGKLAQGFLLKRGASHGIELLGLLTLHVSPVWVLAALADATGAGHTLIQQIAQALKDDGLLEPSSHFESVDQLLDGLEKTSAHLAESLNLPPLDMAGLRREWKTLREELPRIPRENLPTSANLERIWTRLAESAAAQKRSVFAVCSLLAVSTLAETPANLRWLSHAARTAGKRTGEILGAALLSHYTQALEEISRAGFLEYGKRQFRPYLRAAAEQFAPSKESSTERLLRKTSPNG
ncbi:MAG: hypothetical protein WB992_20115 [Bryobacteraceae bacterium]